MEPRRNEESLTSPGGSGLSIRLFHTEKRFLGKIRTELQEVISLYRCCRAAGGSQNGDARRIFPRLRKCLEVTYKPSIAAIPP
ncbi:hypothetical protein FKM82_004819 [Ascaphus truei]